MHDAFLRAGEAHITGGPVQCIEHEGYKLAYTASRPLHALRCQTAQIWAHGYAPLGACFWGNSTDNRDEAAFASFLDKLFAQSQADLIFWPYFPTEVVEFSVLKKWLETNAVSGASIIETRRHLRSILDAADPAGEDGMAGLTLRKKKKKELGRQSRRLADLGAIRVVSTWEGLDPEDALKHFLRAEAAGWKTGKGTALAADENLTRFVRDFVFTMIEERRAQIDLMLLDAECIAGMISLRAGSGLFTWKIGMDEKYARFSPGVQMMLKISRKAIADPSIAYVDSLADADHPMVDHIWGGRRAYSTLIVPLSAKGRLASRTTQIALESKDRLRRTAKKLLRR